MTSQQTTAMLAAAGIGSRYPSIHARTAEEFNLACTLLAATGNEPTSKGQPGNADGTWAMWEWRTEDGCLTLHGPYGYEPSPAEALAAEVVPISDDDRIALTPAGRAHLTVVEGGAA